MKTLKLHSNYTTKEDIQPLKQLPRLDYLVTSNTRSSSKIPDSLELLLLASNLLFKGNEILHNRAKCKKGLYAKDYLLKAIELHNVLDDFENRFIGMSEYNLIVKEFGLYKLD